MRKGADVTEEQEGAKARIGVIVPSVNTIVEPFFNKAVPSGVTIHASRMLLSSELSFEAIAEMDEIAGMQAVRQVASCRCDAIAYCCTASSVVHGLAYDTELCASIAREGAAPATTVAGGILAALGLMAIHTIVIASPYPPALDRAERDFFAAAGYTVIASRGMGISNSFDLAKPQPADIYRFAESVWSDEADALVLTCANFRSHEVVEPLEISLGKPVITSTQASLWRVLRLAGIMSTIPGLGILFRSH